MSKSRPADPAATERRPNPEAVLRRLEWTVLRRLDGLLHGDYRTLFRGSGLDLAGLREYQYHDDVRHIDWNVTARLQVPYVREYHEEREINAWFLLDLSPSVEFGSKEKKRSVSAEFVAVLARLLSRRGNRVGALFYGDKVDAMIPPQGGRRHVLQVLQKMLARPVLKRSGATDLSAFLRSAYRMMPRRSLVFLVSDFISTPGWGDALGLLARRHEVVAVRLYDPLEMEMPNLGLFTIEDAETGEQLFVDTSDKGFRARFAAAAARHERELRASLARAGVDCLELSTEDDLGDALLRFADLRKRSRQAGAGGRAAKHLEVAPVLHLA
jgi:uncharacterized protein (DUF58 family)